MAPANGEVSTVCFVSAPLEEHIPGEQLFVPNHQESLSFTIRPCVEAQTLLKGPGRGGHAWSRTSWNPHQPAPSDTQE